MTSAHLLDDLRRDEGCKLHAYPDPLTGGKPWTVGYGCTGPTIGPKTVWTQQEAEDALFHGVASLTSDMLSALPWIVTLAPERVDVLVNMAWNMGLGGLLGFTTTLRLVRDGKYAEAADAMLRSRWATQVPKRAARLAEQMRTGVHEP